MHAPGIVARYKLRAVAALAALYVGTFIGWSWPWGLLFLSMTLSTIRMGQTQLVDSISRQENPAVFWMVTGTWLLLSGALIGWDLFRWIGPLA